MASYNIKNIDYLRQKANLSYEQAIALLDKFDGDMSRAQAELERQGTPNPEPVQYTPAPSYTQAPPYSQPSQFAQAPQPDQGAQTGAYSTADSNATPPAQAAHTTQNGAQPQSAQPGRNWWDALVELVIKGLRLRLIVTKNKDVLANLPVLYIIAGVIIAPPFALLSIVVMFICGCRVHFENRVDPENDEKIRSYAARTSQTIIKTVSGGGDDKKPGDDKNNPDKQDSDTFTVE